MNAGDRLRRRGAGRLSEARRGPSGRADADGRDNPVERDESAPGDASNDAVGGASPTEEAGEG